MSPAVPLAGYAGSALIAASMMMSNIRRLRWINLAGALIFVGYGLALRAYPVVFLDSVIVVVDAYYLVQMGRKKDYFSLMPVSGAQESLLKRFCEFHLQDIRRFFPGFSLEGLAAPLCVFILRNVLPVGLFIYGVEGGTALRIHLDYVIPEHRDLKNARFLYATQAAFFKGQGFREFRVTPASPEFAAYVRRVGFEPAPGAPGAYVRSI